MNDQKIKILLIEDDKFLSAVYQMKLAEKGYEVVIVSDGKRGFWPKLNQKNPT